MFTLPELNYSYEGLEPAVSRDIMELHHTKHHAGYVSKLNEAVESSGGTIAPDATIDSLLRNLDLVPDTIRTTVRNQGGGHFNHSLFWQCMGPNGGGQPSGELLTMLKDEYGSFQQFVDEFNAKAAGVFGSGWVWLMPDLTIATSPNQDNPIMFGQPEPLMGLDVWEHAYYLDYKNVRADYVKAWWDIIDWDFVQDRYAHKQ